jgi:uncharacterized RDD family membrane protein YckC
MNRSPEESQTDTSGTESLRITRQYDRAFLYLIFAFAGLIFAAALLIGRFALSFETQGDLIAKTCVAGRGMYERSWTQSYSCNFKDTK